MHTSEFGRATNTGSLVALSCAGSRVFVRGVKADDDALAALVADPSRRAILLFPSEDAITTDELLQREQQQQQASEAASGAGGGEGAGRRLVVVIDGTWSGARKLVKCLPGPDVLPRIRLLPHQCAPGEGPSAADLMAGGDGRGGGGGEGSSSEDDEEAGGTSAAAPERAPAGPAPAGRSLLHPVRRYGGAAEVGRVCTLEAVVGLLRALGEADEAACGALLHSLKARKPPAAPRPPDRSLGAPCQSEHSSAARR